MADPTPAPNPVESPPLGPTQIHSKVGAGALAGSVTVLIVWAIQTRGWEIPIESVAALTTVISFVAGYLARS